MVNEQINERYMKQAAWQMNDTWDIWVYTHMPDFQTKS